jgi:sec-independent protein translocase protein TatB
MNILGMGPMEILLIVVLALIVFGPAKLPEIMGQVGKAINDFRRATSDLSDEFNRTIQAELKETRSVVDEAKSAVTSAHAGVTSAISGVPAPARPVVPAETPPVPIGTGPEVPINGTVPDQPHPPLANTSQWSWETAMPSPPRAADAQAHSESSAPAPSAVSDAPAASVPTMVPAEPAPAESSATVVDVPPKPPATPARQALKRTTRDELLPPY